MRVVEVLLAILFGFGGFRSLWKWGRQGFDARDTADHVLYALHLTGRIGLWFAFAGFFLIAALIDATGVAASEELASYRWYVLLPLVLATLQLLSGMALARRGGEGPQGAPTDGPARPSGED